MSKIRLSGSNSGYVEIAAAADAGNLTFTMPTTGTALFGNGNNVISGITTFSQAVVLNSGAVVTGSSVFNDDVTFDSALSGREMVWDKSDNALEFGSYAQIKLDDQASIRFGTDEDMILWHNGNHANIKNTTGRLYILANDIWIKDGNDGDIHARFLHDDACELRFDNDIKLETTNVGVTVTGTVSATSFAGNGEALTRTTALSHRNKLFNGDMRICQRGTADNLAFTNVGSSANTYTLDRWKLYVQNSSARFQIERNYDHSLPDGFQTSMRISCTTTDTSLAATDEVFLTQSLEGQDVQDFAKGTPSAKQYTLSFYARSDKTGTYIVRLLGRDNTTSNVSAAYTMTNTWTRHVITFPADTNSNRKDNPDNGEGLRVMWYLVAGSGINDPSDSLQTTWANTTDTGAATGQVNFADSNSNRDFYITGCQLEAGPVATPFEYIPYAESLSRCKRYFNLVADGRDHIGQGGSRAEDPIGNGFFWQSTRFMVPVYFQVAMRTDGWTLYKRNGEFRYYANGQSNQTLNQNDINLNGQQSSNSAHLNVTNINSSSASGFLFVHDHDAALGFDAEF